MAKTKMTFAKPKGGKAHKAGAAPIKAAKVARAAASGAEKKPSKPAAVKSNSAAKVKSLSNEFLVCDQARQRLRGLGLKADTTGKGGHLDV
jgi:hypothetical protein